MNFSAKRKRFGDIKILEHLMTVIVSYHFNALFGKQPSVTGVVIGAIAFFFPVDINSSSCMSAKDVFSSCQYLRAYSLVKTWIICAYAICDARCVSDANQKGRLMAATTDMVNTLFAMGGMGWCFALL
ncbi:hypothetical protein K492DRAFT_23289 [Lichtheimia hyalospora FSU 10163]|nr:hypothetical protein K492DRAFT_23289 [Lichtheimia hyalospora FSU 10163]